MPLKFRSPLREKQNKFEVQELRWAAQRTVLNTGCKWVWFSPTRTAKISAGKIPSKIIWLMGLVSSFLVFYIRDYTQKRRLNILGQ